MNAPPQFAAEIDGGDTHLIHVRSRHEDARQELGDHLTAQLSGRAKTH